MGRRFNETIDYTPPDFGQSSHEMWRTSTLNRYLIYLANDCVHLVSVGETAGLAIILASTASS